MVNKRYIVNAGSLFSLKYHLGWCPKYRKRMLTNALEKRLRELLYQKAKEIKAEIHALEIMPDHSRLTNAGKNFLGQSPISRVCGLGASTSAASVPSLRQP